MALPRGQLTTTRTSEGKPITATLSLIRTAADGDAQAVKDLLAAGADVNGTNQGGQTPLMLAALMGRQEIVSLLLDAGADAQLRDHHGLTALEWSTRRGFWEVSDLLKRASATVTRLPPKATPDPVHAEEEEEIHPAVAPRVNSEGLKDGGFGPAAKAALKSLHARRESEGPFSTAPEPPQGHDLPAMSEPLETGSYEALDADAVAIGELSIDHDSQRSGAAMDAAADSQSPTLLPGSQPHSLTAALEEPSGDLTTVSPVPESPEAVSLTAQEQTQKPASPSTETSETNLPEATSSAGPVTPEPEPSKLQPTRSQPVSVNERAPSFQTSTLGLSGLTTSGGSSEPENRKRCPQCSTVFENTSLEYCTRDNAQLVPLDEFHFASYQASSSTRPIVWLLMAVVLAGSAFASYRITWYLWNKQAPKSVAAPRVEAPPEVKKVSPTVGGALAGLELNVPEPEYPVEAERSGVSGPVIVQIKVNKNGRVVSAQSSAADRRLSAAAVKAAKQATFSPEKLAQLSPRGAMVSGSITYEFPPTPAVTNLAATSSPAVKSSPTDPAAANTSSATSADPQSPVVGGPLVGAAVHLPTPEYPSVAKHAGIKGEIIVTVRVNRAGKVISWRTSTGDAQLRAAALKAAKKATFSREKLPGTGDVVGTITYRFG